MTNDIAIVSASFGGIDEIKKIPLQDGVDAFFYTDIDTRAEADTESIASWTQVLVPNYPRFDFGPRLRSRYFKHQIHRMDEVKAHRWLVWCDASLQLNSTDFILEHVERLEQLPRRERLLLIPHPERNTIRQEFEYIQGAIREGQEGLRLRYANEKMTEQMKWFQEQGWDLDAKLWCGTFQIIENSDLLSHCWNDWWDQQLRWGMMDQLSLPVMLEKHGCVPQIFDINLRKNDYFTKVPHQGEVLDSIQEPVAPR